MRAQEEEMQQQDAEIRTLMGELGSCQDQLLRKQGLRIPSLHHKADASMFPYRSEAVLWGRDQVGMVSMLTVS